MPYLALFKTLAPILLIISAISGAWFAGRVSVQKQWDIERAQLVAESNLIKETAAKHALAVEAQAQQLNAQIEDNANANRSIIEALADRNRAIVVSRVQSKSTANHCSAVSSATSAATVSHDPSTENWQFFESFISEAKRADELAETLRACQGYVNGLTRVMR